MYEIRCIFCKSLHRSEFFDEIEDSIMCCRDRAPDFAKGMLKDYSENTQPIPVEQSILIAEAEARREEAWALGV